MSRHRNNAWYSYQENSTYPLSPDASLEGSGGPLPNDLLTDCRIVLTGDGASNGAVFLSVLDVNCGHVSLILSLAWNEGTEEILCFSDDAVKIDTIYPLEPLRPGVRGWVIFGSGVLSRMYNSLFEDRDSAGINTSRIIERCLSRPYGRTVLSGVQKYGTNQVLTGDVRLIPSSRLTIGEKSVLFPQSQLGHLAKKAAEAAGADSCQRSRPPVRSDHGPVQGRFGNVPGHPGRLGPCTTTATGRSRPCLSLSVSLFPPW
jgi:hypothetical protein